MKNYPRMHIEYFPAQDAHRHSDCCLSGQKIVLTVNDSRSFAMPLQQQRKKGLNGTRALISAMPVNMLVRKETEWLLSTLFTRSLSVVNRIVT